MTEDFDEYDALVAQLKTTAQKDAQDFGWDGSKFPLGKMEGNPWYVPYLYRELMIDGDGTCYCGWWCAELTDYEIEGFDLGMSWAVGVREDDNGFVHYKLMEQEEFIELQAESYANGEHRGDD